MTRYLVTGGAGFIGSNLVRALLEHGDEVVVLDDFSTGRRSNLEAVAGRFRLVEGSLLDEEALRSAMQGADFVLHLAAIASVQRSFDDPLTAHRVNSEGTLRVLLAARDAGVRRVVAASSSAVYGNGTELPKREELRPAPISPYGLTKLDGEVYGAMFTRVLGLEVVCLRYFNVFGPQQDPASEYAAVIPRFITRMLRGQTPIIYGDGLQSRDFCFVEDVVRANELACIVPQAAGGVFNIASGQCIDLLGLVAALNEVLGTRIDARHEPERPGDIRQSAADISMARRQLGFEPRIDFLDGLRRTVEWYREAGRG